jgi:hypothetical protein
MNIRAPRALTVGRVKFFGQHRGEVRPRELYPGAGLLVWGLGWFLGLCSGDSTVFSGFMLQNGLQVLSSGSNHGSGVLGLRL